MITSVGPRATKIINDIKNTSYSSTYTYPLVIKTGRECILQDIDGNNFLDFTSNIGSCPLGYSHPAIMEILKEYSSNGSHKIAGQEFDLEDPPAPPAARAAGSGAGGPRLDVANSVSWYLDTMTQRIRSNWDEQQGAAGKR